VKRKRIRLKDVIVSVEGGNNFFGKRPDIIIWKPKKMNGTPKIWTDTKINELIEECLAVVELKVTGYELIKQGGKDELYKDIKKYHSTISTWTDSPLPLIFYGCYYEDDPNRIKNLVAPRNLNYKRIVDSYKKTRRLSLNKNFDDNFIEAYGFRGNNEDWLVLKQ
jgi:hypothetical protein